MALHRPKGLAERLWVSVIDSARWRGFVQRSPATRVFRSRRYRNAVRARRFALTRRASRRDPDRFRDVRTFFMMIGHTKSGGTMVGAMLDAHPNVVVADEIGSARFVEEGFGRDQIFQLLLKSSRREAMKGRVTGRRLGGYSFSVPGQWQGRHADLTAIGESKAGPSTRELGADAELLESVFRVMNEVDVKFIQIVRNPFDPISAMMLRSGRLVDDAVDDYFRQCERLEGLRSRIAASDLLVVRYESVVRNPEDEVARICRYLGVKAEPEYLGACAAVLDSRWRAHRRDINWAPSQINEVERRIAGFSFLHGYGYNS